MGTPPFTIVLDPFWQNVYLTVRAIFVVFNVAFFAGFVYAFIKALEYRPKYYLHPPKPAKRVLTLQDTFLRERWEAAAKRFAGGGMDAMRVAIIEADAIADTALKELDLPGEHMADRLERLSEEEIRSLGRIWRAHRVRNNLVHSPDYELTHDEASRTFEDYKAFLEELQIIGE